MMKMMMSLMRGKPGEVSKVNRARFKCRPTSSGLKTLLKMLDVTGIASQDFFVVVVLVKTYGSNPTDFAT
jgi:hypothetical protein